MKGHEVAALGRSHPLCGFAGGGDLVIAVARLVADHGPGASLARQRQGADNRAQALIVTCGRCWPA
jgi:hypothetical protein